MPVSAGLMHFASPLQTQVRRDRLRTRNESIQWNSFRLLTSKDPGKITFPNPGGLCFVF